MNNKAVVRLSDGERGACQEVVSYPIDDRSREFEENFWRTAATDCGRKVTSQPNPPA
jgi:hypothetical protein